jgi:hypothetical protein
MKKTGILGILIWLFTADINAQSNNKVSFQSINQAGLLEGSIGSAFQLQTINGFRYKTYALGIGIGLDYYFERAVPVFLDLRKDLFSKPGTPFIYGEGGIPYIWSKNANDGTEPEYSNQRLYEGGIGYHFPMGKQVQFILSAGYSYRSYTKYSYSPYWIYGYPTENKQRYDYQLRRVSLKMGISF